MQHPDVEIEEILLNGNAANVVNVKPGQNRIEVVVKGRLRKARKMSIEIRVADMSDAPLMFYSPYHTDSPMLPEGDFELKGSFNLPEGLTKGTFMADLYLTNSCVEGLVDIPHAFIIESEGVTTPMGYSFAYGHHSGFIYVS